MVLFKSTGMAVAVTFGLALAGSFWWELTRPEPSWGDENDAGKCDRLAFAVSSENESPLHGD